MTAMEEIFTEDSARAAQFIIALAAWIRRNYGSTMNQALINVPKAGKYKLVFNSDNEEYGGDGKVEAVVVKSAVEKNYKEQWKV